MDVLAFMATLAWIIIIKILPLILIDEQQKYKHQNNWSKAFTHSYCNFMWIKSEFDLHVKLSYVSAIWMDIMIFFLAQTS